MHIQAKTSLNCAPVMNAATKNSMTDDELEEIEYSLVNLILEEEDFQLVQI